jgi:DNA repair protein RadC
MKENLQIHKNHRERMKELFCKNGFNGFSEIQKLEFVLYFAIPQKDTNPLAHRLLDEFGSLNNVLCADYNNLIKINGIGRHAALLIKTFRAVCLETDILQERIKLASADEARAYCYKLLHKANVEEFYIICLDNSNKIINHAKLGSGNVSKVRIDIRSITDYALKHNAAKIIVAHNHPSGKLEFSADDIHFTHSILCSCVLNDIDLADHILVTNENAISMYESRFIEAIHNQLLKTLNVKRKIISDPACPYEQYTATNLAKECPIIDL